MRDVTFYIVGAYGMTAFMVFVELVWLRRKRRKVLNNAVAMSATDSE